MKFYQPVQKLLVEDSQTAWWFDKPTFIFWKYANIGDYESNTCSARCKVCVKELSEELNF
jgi:hypothetical protein